MIMDKEKWETEAGEGNIKDAQGKGENSSGLMPVTVISLSEQSYMSVFTLCSAQLSVTQSLCIQKL